MPRFTSRWLVVLLALLPLLALWRGFVGLVPGPFDQLAPMVNPAAKAPTQPWDVLQADGVLQFYGWRDLVFESWREGKVPVWNPYQLAGTPLLANSQSGALYPLHILMGVLHVPTGLAMFLLAWFHLAWAGLGTRALVKALGGTEIGACIAGASFGLSPFMLAWTALPSVITTVSWIPWMLAAVALPKGSRGRITTLAGSTAMLILSGHLQFVAYGMFAVMLFGVLHIFLVPFRSPGEEDEEPNPSARHMGQQAGRTVAMLLGLGLGLAIANAHLIPTLNYSQFSHRRNTPSEEGYAAYIGGALKPGDLVTRIANPFGQGDPNRKVVEDAPYSQYWPALSRPGANYAESAGMSIGPVVIGLLVLFAFRRPKLGEWLPLGALLGFAWLLALGTPLNRLLYFGVPGWSASGSPGRIAFLGVLAACVAAGLAIRDTTPFEKRQAGIVAGLAGLVALLTLAPMVDPAPNGVAADAWGAISGAAATEGPLFLATILLAVGSVFALATQVRQAPVLAIAATVLVVAWPATRLVRMGDPTEVMSRSAELPPQERVAMENEEWGLVAAAKAFMPPNLAALRRTHELGGYDSLLHRDTVAMLAEINGKDSAPPANGNMMFIKPGADEAKLKEAGVTQIWRRIEGGSNVTNLTDAPGRATLNGTRVEISPDSRGGIVTVKIAAAGELIVRDRALPGWSATLDGKPLTLKENRWLVTDVSGPGTVEFRYTPPGLAQGLMVSVVAFLCWMGAVLVSFRPAKPSIIQQDV